MSVYYYYYYLLLYIAIFLINIHLVKYIFNEQTLYTIMFPCMCSASSLLTVSQFIIKKQTLYVVFENHIIYNWNGFIIPTIVLYVYCVWCHMMTHVVAIHIKWPSCVSLCRDGTRQLTKSLVKHRFSLHNISCVTNAVVVMYSRNIPMAGKQNVCFQSKKVKICSFFISNNYYIYIWRVILKYL